MDIRPITNDAEHPDAIWTTDEHLDLKFGAGLEAELDALLTLVEAYEQRRWPQACR